MQMGPVPDEHNVQPPLQERTPPKPPLHIAGAYFQNVKRIHTIEIRPVGNLIEIKGPNGSGKTSLLDGIFWALASARSHQPVPIREGQTEAHIHLDLGELIIRREFKEQKSGRVTNKLIVETGEGFRAQRPQEVIDALLGEVTASNALAFDPIAFTRMKSERQYEILSQMVGIDLSDIKDQIKELYEERTDENRTAKSRRTAADQIEVRPGTPDEPVSLSVLMEEMDKAERHNERLRRRHQERNQLSDSISNIRRQIGSAEAEIERLRGHIEGHEKTIAKLKSRQETEQEALDGMEIKDSPVDLTPIRQAIGDSERTNQAVANAQRKRELIEEAVNAEKHSEELTTLIDKLKKQMVDDVAAADMPVEGLGLGDDIVTMNGLPLEQSSHADKLRVALGIVMNRKPEPRLKIIIIKESGSLLDENSLKIVHEMAVKYGWQIWIERVDTSATTGFVIEEGRLKGADTEADDEA